MRIATTYVAISLLFISIASAPLRAQTTGQKQVFEVASIRENHSGSGNAGTDGSNGTLLRFTNLTLKDMISFAYNLRDYQISGGPDWIGSTRYDITAKPERKVTDGDTWLGMIQTLLAERFQLRIHREKKDASIYELVIGKTGPKLQPTSTPESGHITASRTYVTATAQSMSKLAEHLSGVLGRQVLDRTELIGKFDFQLSWAPDPGISGTNAASPSDGPSIFTAIQEELGLRLISSKGPVEVLVIDSVQKPTVN